MYTRDLVIDVLIITTSKKAIGATKVLVLSTKRKAIVLRNILKRSKTNLRLTLRLRTLVGLILTFLILIDVLI